MAEVQEPWSRRNTTTGTELDQVVVERVLLRVAGPRRLRDGRQTVEALRLRREGNGPLLERELLPSNRDAPAVEMGRGIISEDRVLLLPDPSCWHGKLDVFLQLHLPIERVLNFSTGLIYRGAGNPQLILTALDVVDQ